MTDDKGAQNQLEENSLNIHTERHVQIKKQTGVENITRHEVSQSYEPHRFDVINEECTNDENSLNATSLTNQSRMRPDTHCSEADALRAHSSELKESKRTSSQRTHKLLRPSHVCDVCNKTFKNSRNLVNHKNVHTGLKPFICDICTKGFNQPTTLARHKVMHSAENPYVCGICKKRFNQPFNLARHEVIHTDQKHYACDVCKKRFNQPSSLARHKVIHSDEKSYVCDICKKAFRRSDNLAKHRLIHQ